MYFKENEDLLNKEDKNDPYYEMILMFDLNKNDSVLNENLKLKNNSFNELINDSKLTYGSQNLEMNMNNVINKKNFNKEKPQENIGNNITSSEKNGNNVDCTNFNALFLNNDSMESINCKKEYIENNFFKSSENDCKNKELKDKKPFSHENFKTLCDQKKKYDEVDLPMCDFLIKNNKTLKNKKEDIDTNEFINKNKDLCKNIDIYQKPTQIFNEKSGNAFVNTEKFFDNNSFNNYPFNFQNTMNAITDKNFNNNIFINKENALLDNSKLLFNLQTSNDTDMSKDSKNKNILDINKDLCKNYKSSVKNSEPLVNLQKSNFTISFNENITSNNDSLFNSSSAYKKDDHIISESSITQYDLKKKFNFNFDENRANTTGFLNYQDINYLDVKNFDQIDSNNVKTFKSYNDFLNTKLKCKDLEMNLINNEEKITLKNFNDTMGNNFFGNNKDISGFCENNSYNDVVFDFNSNKNKSFPEISKIENNFNLQQSKKDLDFSNLFLSNTNTVTNNKASKINNNFDCNFNQHHLNFSKNCPPSINSFDSSKFYTLNAQQNFINYPFRHFNFYPYCSNLYTKRIISDLNVCNKVNIPHTVNNLYATTLNNFIYQDSPHNKLESKYSNSENFLNNSKFSKNCKIKLKLQNKNYLTLDQIIKIKELKKKYGESFHGKLYNLIYEISKCFNIKTPSFKEIRKIIEINRLICENGSLYSIDKCMLNKIKQNYQKYYTLYQIYLMPFHTLKLTIKPVFEDKITKLLSLRELKYFMYSASINDLFFIFNIFLHEVVPSGVICEFLNIYFFTSYLLFKKHNINLGILLAFIRSIPNKPGIGYILNNLDESTLYHLQLILAKIILNHEQSKNSKLSFNNESLTCIVETLLTRKLLKLDKLSLKYSSENKILNSTLNEDELLAFKFIALPNNLFIISDKALNLLPILASIDPLLLFAVLRNLQATSNTKKSLYYFLEDPIKNILKTHLLFCKNSILLNDKKALENIILVFFKLIKPSSSLLFNILKVLESYEKRLIEKKIYFYIKKSSNISLIIKELKKLLKS